MKDPATQHTDTWEEDKYWYVERPDQSFFDSFDREKATPELLFLDSGVSKEVCFLLKKQNLETVLGLRQQKDMNSLKVFFADSSEKSGDLRNEARGLLQKSWDTNSSDIASLAMLTSCKEITTALGPNTFADVNLGEAAKVLGRLNRPNVSCDIDIAKICKNKDALAHEKSKVFHRFCISVKVISLSNYDCSERLLHEAQKESDAATVIAEAVKILQNFITNKQVHTVDRLPVRTFLSEMRDSLLNSCIRNRTVSLLADRKGLGKKEKGKPRPGPYTDLESEEKGKGKKGKKGEKGKKGKKGEKGYGKDKGKGFVE